MKVHKCRWVRVEYNGHLEQCRATIKCGDLRCAYSCNRLGWNCLKSPTGHCKYNTKEDPLRDNCIYCGQPDERK